MHQDSLPAPSLPGQSFSVANESCSGLKKQQKTVPHPLPPTTIDKLHSSHKIKSQTINQTALTIRNGSQTNPGFDLRRADGNFRLWWKKLVLKKCPKKFPNVRTKLGLLGQNVRSKFQSSWNPEVLTGVLQCNGRKLEEAENFECVFVIYSVLESK